MITWKNIALGAYYLATLGERRRAAAERVARYREPVRILFCHRVADTHPTPWSLSTKAFAAQVRWLRERYDLVTLSEAQDRIASGRNRWPTACITFDDGYADNLKFAFPLLLKHHIPFTCFVSTAHVSGGLPFAHDVQRGQPLEVLSRENLVQLARAGVELGAHTRTHANLGGEMPADRLHEELVGSKEELEKMIDGAVKYFAFPFGLRENLSAAAFRMAYEAGFEGVCSAYGGYNFPGDDPFHLRRFHADTDFMRFVNWMTVDPRKLRQHQEYDAGNFRTERLVASTQ
ncbi:MAG: polysaccharide deacetylase family protein [Pirellulales bacterium]|nr:polysaccharide deacetylase family protein [Pirellulales bacterium]